MRRWVAGLCAVLVLLPGGGNAADVAGILSTHARFSNDQIARLERGEVVVNSIHADASEVAIAAAAILRVPISFYLERFGDIQAFKRSDEVEQVGRFSTPPAAADLSRLTLENDDARALRGCRPGDCEVKLDAEGIRFVAARPDDIPGAFREHLARYAARYLREGQRALMLYHDDPEPEPLARDFQQILARLPFLGDQWPALARAAGNFDGTLAPPLQQFLYWSRERPAGKSVVSITHAIIQPEHQGTAVVITKQVYASHYMTGSVGVTILVNRGTREDPRTLLLYFNRSRVDVFEGLLAAVKRAIVRSRARGAAERMMGGLRTRLERQFRASSR